MYIITEPCYNEIKKLLYRIMSIKDFLIVVKNVTVRKSFSLKGKI